MAVTRSSITAVKQMIRQTLLADDELNALVTGRVYSAHIMDADERTVKYPNVIFEMISGNARWHGHVQSQVFELYTYSKESPDQCGVVYDRAFEVMHHERMTLLNAAGTETDASGVAFEVQRAVEGYNREVHAWWLRGRWQMNVAT